MRFSILLLVFIAGCFDSVASLETAGGDDVGDPPPTSGAAFCTTADDCRAAAPTCCECPAFAVGADDPKAAVCDDVDCPPASCPDNVEVACNEDANTCVLQCKPLACEVGCLDGYARDASGCLSCTCAPAPNDTQSQCVDDDECVRTRADCCGCANGGFDTAVIAGDQTGFDGSLMCEPDPACPGFNNCTADEPHCVQGACALAPDRPSDACGSAADAACPAGTVCTVNASDQANLYGLGVCRPR